MKQKMVLCTKLPENRMEELKKYCDITIAGELKHGKGAVSEEMLRKECTGYELVVLGDENAGAETITAWINSGMKFIGVAKGTPVTVDNETLKKAGIALSYTPGRNATAVAEFTIGLMIAAARNIVASAVGLQKGDHLGKAVPDIYDVPDEKNVIWGPLDKNHPFSDYGIGCELHGRTLGIVGYGAIGSKAAHLAQAFGMKVIAFDAYCPTERMKNDSVQPVTRDELLQMSDFVSIHLPVTEETKASINDEWFSKMKKTAYFINTARAAVVDQKALVDALEHKLIAGAAIDVYWQEPVPENHPLLKMKNVVCTPHMAGLTVDVDTWSGEIMSEEIMAYLEGKKRNHIWTQ
jgi:D-3-phosphoglycerate dehydrogenase / 2-oxoglutarate reductase